MAEARTGFNHPIGSDGHRSRRATKVGYCDGTFGLHMLSPHASPRVGAVAREEGPWRR